MSQSQAEKPGLKKLGVAKRRTINVSDLITADALQPGRLLPLVVQPLVEELNLVAWARNNREYIDAQLLKHGGILFRNFNVDSADEFEQFVAVVSDQMLEYRERSSPRSHVRGNIYTSTDYPADHSIFLHNENSYQRTWPLKICFCCLTAAQQGGETPIADCRNVFNRIDPAIRERFIEQGWMYVRNFGEGFGLPWQTVFQTTDRAAVEEYCHDNNISVEWRDGDRLRTRAVRPAVVPHPRTGELVWFNHATFFNVSTLEPEARAALLADFPEEDLPANTYYGDGSPIEPATLDQLRDAYHQETVAFPWQEGDVLLLDNVLAAHGRAPYAGPRKVLVGMGEPHSHDAFPA